MDHRDPEQRFIQSLFEPPAAVKTAAAGLSEVDDQTEVIETTEADGSDRREKEPSASAPTHINLFQHPGSHPAVLDLLLLRKYGPEWMLWEPEVLQARIPQDFRTSGVSDLNMHKIQAMKTLHATNSPWQRWEVFVWCAMPLNGIYPDFQVMQVPSVAQCLVAVDDFNKVRSDVAWSEELKGYLGTVWRHDGVFTAIDPADFIAIDRSGTDLDYGKIAEMWPTVRKQKSAPSDDTAEAEQLRRMLTAHQALEDARALFDQQVETVLAE